VNGHFASVDISFSPLVAGTRLQGKQVRTTVWTRRAGRRRISSSVSSVALLRYACAIA
jgi:hypothetical protein